MKTIDLFYQGNGISEFDQVEVAATHTISMIKTIIADKHGMGDNIFVFLEDQEEPLGGHLIIGAICVIESVKMHFHECAKVETSVSFGGETVHHKFAPSMTVGAIKKWAAIGKFRMTEAEAGEHRLQITGTKDRPAPGTHIGSLTHCPQCCVHFDLVPDERINGTPTGTV